MKIICSFEVHKHLINVELIEYKGLIFNNLNYECFYLRKISNKLFNQTFNSQSIPLICKSILKETLTPRTQRLVSAKAKNYYWLQSTIYEIALPSPVTHQKGENCIVGIYWEGTILSSKQKSGRTVLVRSLREKER